MNSAIILAALKKHISLAPEEEEFWASSFVARHVKQGEILEEPGEITRYFVYVNSGCLTTYFTDQDDTIRVLQFATTGWWTGDLHSYMKQEPSIYTIKALADSEVLLLTKSGLDNLLEKNLKFERYFRIIFQNALVTQHQRLIESYSCPAETRYQNFLEKYPTLEQFVPLKYIAAYLGITPEFLSKIRRKLMTK
jgi:CRP-like cAMP-binding protein